MTESLARVDDVVIILYGRIAYGIGLGGLEVPS
jgi:hypothetical protein